MPHGLPIENPNPQTQRAVGLPSEKLIPQQSTWYALGPLVPSRSSATVAVVGILIWVAG